MIDFENIFFLDDFEQNEIDITGNTNDINCDISFVPMVECVDDLPYDVSHVEHMSNICNLLDSQLEVEGDFAHRIERMANSSKCYNELDRFHSAVSIEDDLYASKGFSPFQAIEFASEELSHENDCLDFSSLKQVSFTGIYSESEIEKFEHDVEMAYSKVKSSESEVSNWKSKVSLLNTKAGHSNGDYENAVRRLNEAESHYNDAVDEHNRAKSRLNNAR